MGLSGFSGFWVLDSRVRVLGSARRVLVPSGMIIRRHEEIAEGFGRFWPLAFADKLRIAIADRHRRRGEKEPKEP